ncbi:hypothetical protein B0919_01715 [Hymenobacter sp. CRA2]|nr:hypothetical protein B0919_01715 [Hymenobacter sp. CRA2]
MGYHRYVGTVDGRPVLAEVRLWTELSVAAYPDTVWEAKLKGSFYYRATARGGYLGNAEQFHPEQWLETYGWDYQDQYNRRWVPRLCAEQPPGRPLLTGWYYPEGQTQPVRVQLREDYTDGVRYELLEEESWGAARVWRADGTGDSSTIQRTYLHLLGPDTLRPALARLQCPVPAARRRARLARLPKSYGHTLYRDFIDVTLNEAGLLAYTHDDRVEPEGTRYYEETTRCHLLDLRTGRELLLVQQFRPGSLQRLLTRQALADTALTQHRTRWWSGGQLPLASARLTIEPTGIRALYHEHESEEKLFIYDQYLTWAALRPLLRPNSPLHRLLRIRGL